MTGRFGGADARGMATLTVAAMLAQALTLAGMPLLTRAYDTGAFGSYAVLLSWAAIATAAFGLGLPAAVVADKSDDAAKRAGRLAALLGGLSGAAGAIVVLLAVSTPAEHRLLGPVGAVMVLTMSGVHVAVIRHVNLRYRRFRSLAIASVCMSLCMVLAQLALSTLSVGSWGLVAGALLGQSVFIALLVRRADWRGWRGLSGVLRRQKDFVRYRMPQELLAVSAQGLPQLAIGVLYGASAAGIYALAYRVVAAPGRVLADTMGQVMFSRISKLDVGRELTSYLRRWTLLMIVLGSALFAPLAILSLFIFQPIFGGEWKDAGPAASWLSFWLWCSFVNVPCVRAIPALNLQKFHLAHEVTSTLIRVLSIVVASTAWKGNVTAAIACFSVASGLLSLVLVVVVLLNAPRVRSR